MVEPLSIKPRPIAAKSVLTREGALFRVTVSDHAGDTIEALSGLHDSHRAAYGFAAGVRMTTGCPLIDLSCPEID